MLKLLHRRPSASAVLGLALPILLAWGAFRAAPVAAASAPKMSLPQEGESPTLVVVLVVDQLRGDLLDRYSSLFQVGFHRLLTEGLVYTHALHRHAATETSPGHAAISTGSLPARAGIPANVWREGEGGEARTVTNVVDPQEQVLGAPGSLGASPRVLRRTGLADWVRGKSPEAQVVSVSAKARAAVLMAGQSDGDVFWFDPQLGRFVTSTWYRPENPPWLNRFNQEVIEAYRADSVWTSTIPAGREDLSSPDTVGAEGDGINTFFPHHYSLERFDPEADDFFLWFEQTPMLDAATLQLARVAMEERGLGTVEGRTDFLSVSLSQTDRVGHAFGPLSREQMDNLLRLDRELGAFLSFLDEAVGPGRYVLGLTADHGVMTMPEREGARGMRLTAEGRARLQDALGQAVRAGGNSDSSVASAMTGVLRGLSFVGPSYTHQDLEAAQPEDTLFTLFRGSFVPGRSGGLLSRYGVEMWWSEYVLDWNYARGTTHGSPYPYDRWVPLILLGPGIEQGTISEEVSPLDLAPTLAALAGIPFPDDLDGHPLLKGRE